MEHRLMGDWIGYRQPKQFRFIAGLTVLLVLACGGTAEASGRMCVGHGAPTGAHTYVRVPQERMKNFVDDIHQFAVAHSFTAFDYPNERGTRIKVLVGLPSGLALIFSNLQNGRAFRVSISDCAGSQEWVQYWQLTKDFLRSVNRERK